MGRGLQRICRAYGGIVIHTEKGRIKYVWDYVANEAVPESEMPVGSERWKASERARWLSINGQARQP